MDFGIIAKHFASEASEQETQTLNRWIAEKPDNQVLYHQLKNLWTATNADLDQMKLYFDTEAAWNKVMGRIQTPVIALHRQAPTKSRPLWAWAVAASVAVVLLVFGGYLWQSQVQKTPALLSVRATTPQTVKLPDGTEVQLNKNAVLEYPAEFVGNTREVRLSGEGFFEVAHNAAKPFIITAEDTKIKVLGTSFNVRAKNGKSEVAVKTGKVSFSVTGQKQELLLTPGKKGSFDNGQLSMSDVSANDLAWQTKMITFNGENLVEVMNVMSQYYQVEIKFEIPNMDDALACKINESYQNQTIEQVLEDLKLLLDVQYRKNADGSITIIAAKCMAE